jgi:outer membrane protein TolC
MRRGYIVLAGCVSFLLAAAPLVPAPPPLTLEEASELARQGSEVVRLKDLAVQKSRLALDEAGSRVWPHVDLQASASYLPKPPKGALVPANSLSVKLPSPPLPPSPPLTFPTTDAYIGGEQHQYISLTATLSQPLFTWGKISNAVEVARLQVEAAGTDLAAQRLDIDREVHRAYFSTLLAQESQRVLARLRDTAAEVVADRQKSFDDGTTNRQNVMEAQANLASIEARLVEAEQSASTARESLGILTGREPSSIVLASGYGSGLPALDEQSVLAQAMAASTDLAATRNKLTMARRNLDIQKGGMMLLPDVMLGVSLNVAGQEDLGYSSTSFSSANTWDWNLAISLGVKMSAFDGLASYARIGQADMELSMAGTGVTLTEKRVRLAVRRAVDAATRADAGVKEKQAAADLAEERLKNARLSFDNGAASREDLRGADIMAGTAELDLQLALFTREEARADLARLTAARF